MTKPTHTTFHLNGNIYLQEWRTNDLILHRTDGPALIIHYANGQIGQEHWYENGLQHRIDDPACKIYHYKNELIQQIDKKYYLYDIHITCEIQDWLVENNITAPYSKEDRMAIILRWG